MLDHQSFLEASETLTPLTEVPYLPLGYFWGRRGMGQFRKLPRVGPWNQDPFKEQENLGLRVWLSFWFQSPDSQARGHDLFGTWGRPEGSAPCPAPICLSPSTGRSLFSDGHNQTATHDPGVGGPVGDARP